LNPRGPRFRVGSAGPRRPIVGLEFRGSRRCRNWFTERPQKAPPFGACGFESRPPHVRTEAEREEANRLFSTGLSAWQITKAMGIPRSTIRDWVEPGRQDRQRYTPVTRLPRKVDFIALPKHDHAYLLGLYLGDGTISGSRRGVYRLRIFMDSRCPKIIGETVRAMQAVMPRNKVNVQKK